MLQLYSLFPIDIKSCYLFLFIQLFYILLSLLLFSFRLKNILKLYPLLKCMTSFSNIFHRNGYAIRPYILPFTILFTIHSHTDIHALQYTHLNHTKIFSHLLKDLTRYIKNNIGRRFLSWHQVDRSFFPLRLYLSVPRYWEKEIINWNFANLNVIKLL